MRAKLSLQCDDKFFLLLKFNISSPFLSPDIIDARVFQLLLLNLKKVLNRFILCIFFFFAFDR